MPLDLYIDGRSCAVADGGTILEAVRGAGLDLPTLCHDDRLRPSGACRLCLVEVDGGSHWAAACATPAVAGARIVTRSPAIEDYRRTVLTMMARDYPAAAVSQAPETPFHRLLKEYGIAPAPIATEPRPADTSHPFIAVDLARCIECYRCVRICDQLQGQGVWSLRGRGAGISIVSDRVPLALSSCVSCGACVDTCPTGALEDAMAGRLGPAMNWTRTVCPYCGVGCELLAGSRDGRLVSMRPAPDAPVNRGHLCVKGRYGFEFVDAPDRVTTPMIRRAGAWQETSWDEAIGFAADRLRDVIGRHGPDQVGILGSARATNEDNYVAQKFARVVLGTNNVDCCARVCHAPSAAGLKQAVGAGLATNSFDDLERAGAILLWGANSTESHPVIGARIRQAVRHGARLIVVDPRRTELALCADLHLQLQPGTDIALANAMAQVIVEEGLYDYAFVKSRTAGLAQFAAFLEDWSPGRVAASCGVGAATIREAARLYAGARPAISFHGLGLTEHVQGTDGVMALINLALLTGNLGKPGAGVNPLRGQNNVQGAAHMGCDPAVLPGSIPLEAGRHAFGLAWGTPLPSGPGRKLPEMLDEAADGRFKALWAIGYDVLLSNPHALHTTRAMDRLELVIVQDLFMTATARRFADVFFPACSSFEKNGTFMNAERRIQRVRQVIPPAGASKADWEILCAMAGAMGHAEGFVYDGAEAIWNEMRSICEGARGMSYARLETAGLQWPCPDETHPGTPVLHQTSFGAGPRATLRAIAPGLPAEGVTTAFPYLLITGRTLYQFNAATMTSRGGLDRLRPEDRLDISPVDADRVGLQEGDPTLVTSRYGQVTLPVHVSGEVAPGQLFATFHTADAFVNLLTGPHRDPVTATPAYKITAVRLELLPA
jgi:formate dehydrogenase major subunit